MRDDYFGLPYNSLRNPFLQLDYLTTAGPRLVGLYLAGRSENLLAELPNVISKTPLGDFRFLGGHRLWHAPEAHPRTYDRITAGWLFRRPNQEFCCTGMVSRALASKNRCK